MQRRWNVAHGSSLEVAAGVWQTDAPAGYIGLVVYDTAKQLVMRLEIAEGVYSPSILPPLEEWVSAQANRRQVRLIG